MSESVSESVSVRRPRVSPGVLRAQKRLERLLRLGALAPPRGSLVVTRATDPEELKEAYALVHAVFVRQGYIAPMPRGLRLRVYELLPEMCTFVARLDGRVAGVMSVVPDSPDLGLPSDVAFRAELELLRCEERRLVEITNLAVRDELRNTSVFLELARSITAHVIEQGFDDAFVAISPRHAQFFEGILRFEPWGARRAYDRRGSDWVQGCHCDVGRFEAELAEVDAVLGERAFLRAWFFGDGAALSRERDGNVRPLRAPDRSTSAEVLRALLDDPGEWLGRLSPRERRALGERWRAAG